MLEVLSKLEMIKAVREFLSHKGFEVRPPYDPVFEPARVPVFAYSKSQLEKQMFVDIITERQITFKDYFKKRDFSRSLQGGFTINNANSAQFFRHYFPLAEVYWAIPSYLDKEDREFKIFSQRCKEDNIGLLVVERRETGQFSVTELYSPPLPLIEERIQLIIGKLNNKIKQKQEKELSNILRRYSEEDISYLVFYPEPKYLATDISIRDHDFSISRELINKLGDLQHVSYKDKLIRFSKDYFHHAEDDYKLALNIIKDLWSEYDLELPNLHLDFESILKLDPRYRDHFLHAFQVFLFGVYVIDSMYDESITGLFGDGKGNRIEDAWLFAATYHDYNYMIQKFEEWTKTFFQNALHLDANDKSPASLHLSESYVRKGYMFNTKRLAKMLSIKNFDNKDLDFFYDRILEKKNHGLISSLSLLKYLDIKTDHCLQPKVIDAACKAIAIHDRNIWQYLCGMAKHNNADLSGNEFKAKKIISKIFFTADPIPFLLVLIDSIQEDGRSRDASLKIELEKLECEDGTIHCEMSFKGHKSDEAFHFKKQELKSVSEFLEGDDKFIISLKSISGNVKDNTSITI